MARPQRSDRIERRQTPVDERTLSFLTARALEDRRKEEDGKEEVKWRKKLDAEETMSLEPAACRTAEQQRRLDVVSLVLATPSSSRRKRKKRRKRKVPKASSRSSRPRKSRPFSWLLLPTVRCLGRLGGTEHFNFLGDGFARGFRILYAGSTADTVYASSGCLWNLTLFLRPLASGGHLLGVSGRLKKTRKWVSGNMASGDVLLCFVR